MLGNAFRLLHRQAEHTLKLCRVDVVGGLRNILRKETCVIREPTAKRKL